MKLKMFLVILSILLFTNISYASSFKADAQTKRIPAGTKLKFRLLDPLATSYGKEGDYFSAMLLDDQKSKSSVILPAGSIVRGSISKINPSKRLSRGAVIYLDFDHIVTPSGRQVPLSLSLYNRANLTFDGGIYGSLGYGEAIKKNWNKTVEITKNATEFGLEIGESFTGASVITTPLCSLGGALGGGLYFVTDSIVDLFRKGDDVYLNQGAILDVKLSHPIDVPVN